MKESLGGLGPVPAPSSPLSSPGCGSTQSWLPVGSPGRLSWSDCQMEGKAEPGDGRGGTPAGGRPPAPFCEELFCGGQTPIPLVGALAPPPERQSDVVKRGYLGKLERRHRRYFVLRAGSHTGPSRLEWHKTQGKFTAVEKSSGRAVLFGANKQGVIYLRCCIGVSRICSSRKGHTVALYANDQTMVLVAEDQQEQEEWYLAIKKLMEEEWRDEEHGQGFDEEDDGYCTLPPAAFFKEVWPVTVKSRDLGRSKSLAGETRLCLTATSLILARVGARSDSVTIPLLSVRRFGHLDGAFFLELGRSAPNGPGEIWMEARDQGNPAVAQHIHEVVREAVRALRALPDFSRSPTSSHNRPQTLLAPKRCCRPKYRSKPAHAKVLGSPMKQEIQTSPTRSDPEPRGPDKTGTPHGAAPETGGYMDMRSDRHLPANAARESDFAATATEDHCSVAALRLEGWDPGETEGLGYMVMMSPQGGCSSCAPPQDDYVTMASQHKYDGPAFSPPPSPLQTSCDSAASELSPPRSSTPPEEDARQEREQERTPAQGEQPLAQDDATSSPGRSAGIPGGAVRASPGPDASRCGRGQTVLHQPAFRRYRLSSCLPSCLQVEERS